MVSTTWVARVIAGVWGAWWSFFAIAQVQWESRGLAGNLPPFVFAAMVGAMALLPWKWPSTGWMLVLFGLAVTVCYPLATRPSPNPGWISFVLGTLALPAIVAGLIFIMGVKHRAVPGST